MKSAWSVLTLLTVGPANDLARAPTSTKVFHRLSLRFGLDVVLEQKRGRRY